MMRGLLAFVLGLGILWSGYWFVGSAAIENRAEAWFSQQSAMGRVAEHESLVVRGFPNRFDLTLNGLHLADPRSGWGWDAPFVQIFAMTWKPWHLIAAFPPNQVFVSPFETLTVGSDRLMASLVLHPGPDLALDRTVVEGEGLKISSDAGWTASLEKFVASTAEDTSQKNAHRIGLNLSHLGIDPSIAAELPDLGADVALVNLDATVLLSEPVDRHTRNARPDVTGVTLSVARVDWGVLHVSAQGQVKADADGYAEGKIVFRIEQWQQVPNLLLVIGAIAPSRMETVMKAMEFMAKFGKDPDVLELPLTFKAGNMALGPMPIGPAPKLYRQ